MTFHAIKEYIRYRFTAVGRHGLHSPFAYHLVDNCLLNSPDISLYQRLTDYFGNKHIIWLPAEHPYGWPDIDNINPGPDTVIIIPSIHKTAIHSRCWKSAASLPEVKMSIDLYDYGLLLFQPEFRVKQNFVLKRI